MKKRLLRLGVLSIIFSICLCFCLAACKNNNEEGGNVVAAPLTAPVVTIDGNGKATWGDITNASGYTFKINGGEEQTAENREVQLEDGQSVAVKAKGDGVNYSDSDWSEAKTYTAPDVGPVKLDTPAVTVYKDGHASWKAITNASKYIVKIDGKESETEALSARLKNGEAISVQAVGDGTAYSSGDFSASKTYKAPATLAAPENLTATVQGTDAGKVILSWNAVEGASGYRYIINNSEQNAATVEENSVTVDLSEIDAAKLDSTWVFRVKALGNDAEEIADDGDYSDCRTSGSYCLEAAFAVSNDEIYTVAEISEIINYYGEALPYREFMVSGTIASNADGKAVLENGFTLFGSNVPELYLAIDNRLTGYTVTTVGTLKKDGTVKGLSCSNSTYYPIDFENIGEQAAYELVIETLNAWDILQEDSKIINDFYIPLKLYGVNIEWNADEKEAFAIDDLGNVTITCPAEDEDDIVVVLEAMLYIDDGHSYDEVLEYILAITHKNLIQLATPKININPKTGVATWNAVEHAVRYRYNLYGCIDDDYTNWETNYIDETGYIEAGEKLEIQMYNKLWLSVRAIGDGVTYSDSEVDPKQYNYYPETIEPDGTPLEFDLTVLTQTGELANPTFIFGLACGNSSVFESASATRVELGNSYTTGAVTGTGFIKVGSANNNGKITLNFNKKINGVVICARQWNEDQTDKISVNGSEEQTASKNDWGIMYFNFTASNASATVEIDTNNRVFIQSITVYVAD